MTYTTGTLSLAFYDRQGNPLTNGTVLIVPNAPLVKDTTGHKVLSGSVSVVVGKTATYPVTVDLPATDDATLDPAGVTYTVIPPKKWADPVSGVAIYAGQTRHFADLLSVDPLALTYQPGDVTHAELVAVQADVTDLGTTVNGKIPLAQKGAASGVAPLDGGSRVPEANLPANLAAAALSATFARKFRRTDLPRPSQIRRVMSSPPTIGAAVTTSTITSGVLKSAVLNTAGVYSADPNAPILFLAGGNFQAAGQAFPNNNYVVAKSITNPILTTASYVVEFMTDAQVVELSMKGNGGYFRLKIDHEYVSTNATQMPNDGSVSLIPITFADKRVRRVTMETYNVFFGGVRVGPNDTVWKPQPRGLRCIVLGDSFTEGTGATGLSATGYVRAFAEYMGWPDTWSSGVGGTGYLNPSTGGKVKFRDRLTADVTAFAPDVILFAGGINDTAYTKVQVQTEATALFLQAKTENPNAIVAAFGPWWKSDQPTQPAIDVRDGIQAAAAAAGVTYIPTFAPFPFTGTGKVGATTGSGNADLYISSDGTHPTQAGHDYLGAWAAERFMGLTFSA